MRELRQSGSEGGGTKSIASPYPYKSRRRYASRSLDTNKKAARIDGLKSEIKNNSR